MKSANKDKENHVMKNFKNVINGFEKKLKHIQHKLTNTDIGD